MRLAECLPVCFIKTGKQQWPLVFCITDDILFDFQRWNFIFEIVAFLVGLQHELKYEKELNEIAQGKTFEEIMQEILNQVDILDRDKLLVFLGSVNDGQYDRQYEHRGKI